MPTDTIDLIEHQMRTGTEVNQIDTNLRRISVSTYAQQTNKNIKGKPSQIYISVLLQKQGDILAYSRWHTDIRSCIIGLKGIDGLSSGVSGCSTSLHFVPCLTTGLAYILAMKKQKQPHVLSPLKLRI